VTLAVNVTYRVWSLEELVELTSKWEMLMARAQFDLKVSFHQSGRYTLMESVGGAAYSDLPGPLSGNNDPTEFYRAVVRHLAKQASEGTVAYHDKDDDRSI
jgi:hypothetical protein